SKEKVSCTDVCVVAAACGLATALDGGLLAGAIGIWVVSGMVAGVVVCGNTGSMRIAAGKSGAGSVTASTSGDLMAAEVVSDDAGCFCSIGATSGSADFSSAEADSGTFSAASGTSLGASGVIAKGAPNLLMAETSATSGVCGPSGRELSAVCSMTGPTDDSKIGSPSRTSGALGCGLSAVCSMTGPTDDSKTGSPSGTSGALGSGLSAVCSMTGPTNDSKTGSPSGTSGALGCGLSAVCSTTAPTDDSKTGSVSGANSRSGSPLS